MSAELRKLATDAKARADAATSGPFIAIVPGTSVGIDIGCTWSPYAGMPCEEIEERARTAIRSVAVDYGPFDAIVESRKILKSQREANADFFAASRTDVPALADALLAALDELDRIRGATEALADNLKAQAARWDPDRGDAAWGVIAASRSDSLRDVEGDLRALLRGKP